MAACLALQALTLAMKLPAGFDAFADKLDGKVLSTVLMGALSLLYVRKQFSFGMRPIADYRSWEESSSHLGLGRKDAEQRFFSVHLANVGAGPMLVRRAEYRAGPTLPPGAYSDFRSAISEVNRLGLRMGRDISVINLGVGTAMESRGERPVFEVDLGSSAVRLLKVFDVRIEFEGLLGDLYVKELFYVPRRGIDSLQPDAGAAQAAPKVATHVSPDATGPVEQGSGRQQAAMPSLSEPPRDESKVPAVKTARSS